jgi:hypothetical protein
LGRNKDYNLKRNIILSVLKQRADPFLHSAAETMDDFQPKRESVECIYQLLTINLAHLP